MGTMILPLTGFSTSNQVPGTYIEVKFAQGELLGNGLVPKVLFIGPKTSAGAATVDTQVYPIYTEQDAIDNFGAGSPVHRMFRRFSQVCKSAMVYGIAALENSGGTAATDTITFTGTAGATGTASATVCGETVSVSFVKDDTPTVIALALKNQMALQTHWPVIPTVDAGVITLTNKVKGANGNCVRIRANITSGVTTTVAVASALPTLSLIHI